MKKTAAIIGAGILAASFAQASKAADMDYTAAVQQLVVSGMVESWTGYTLFGKNDTDDEHDDYFDGSRSGRLSLPLGTNLSIQMDVDNEVNSSWMLGDSDDYGDDFHYSWQGLGHLSFRDPATGLIGVFGGAGVGVAGDRDHMPLYVVGGEAQLYLSDFTIYGQAGYLDGDADEEDQLVDAGFGRGVVRWFISENSRLQGEFSYVDGTVEDNDATVMEWGARYDTVLGLPVIGDTNVFVGYRGNNYELDDDGGEQLMDHTFMVGFRSWFGGNTLLEFDRVGATLDAPNFGRWTASGL